MIEKKLDSLIMLLDDPDDSVFHVVQDELMKEDISVVDHLEHVWETSLDELVQKRIESIIQKIQLTDTKEKIKHWSDQKSIDLFEGCFLISRHQYPELKQKFIQLQLDKIRQEIWLEFRNSLTSLEKITILNHVFYDRHKFKVDYFNPESPHNSYINRILDTKKGNPVSIAILYTLIARSLNLPVHYIDFQKNPLVGYFDKDMARLVHGEETENPILFYINPSNSGAIIGPKEVDYIQHTTDDTERQKLVVACPDRIIIKRLIEKLVIGYRELGQADKVNYLNEIAAIL
ncbi:MAG: transglutaminase-like domain-containing protein [Prolixibacteraceae bacterium]|nr:transglutaminase-like domain-containing protein [Prolixibacteraceae bacterium]